METYITTRIPREGPWLARDPNSTSFLAQPETSGWEVSPDELIAEHSKGSLPSPLDVEGLTQTLGIPPQALAHEHNGRPNPLRRDKIVRCGRHFEFARDARRENDVQAAFTLLAFDTCGEPLDIVAFRPRPHLQLSLLGRVTLVGEDQVLRPHLRRGLRVHRTLWGYLAHRRRGIVVMNFSRAALLLHDIRLIPEDENHRRELRRKLVAGPIVLAPGED
jgi:hypothetical protein